jgi:hypothetical protein
MDADVVGLRDVDEEGDEGMVEMERGEEGEGVGRAGGGGGELMTMMTTGSRSPPRTAFAHALANASGSVLDVTGDGGGGSGGEERDVAEVVRTSVVEYESPVAVGRVGGVIQLEEGRVRFEDSGAGGPSLVRALIPALYVE